MTDQGSRNPVERVSLVLQEEGVAALFAGVAPRMLRAIASGAIQFATYELTQNFLSRL
jgi:hypothetical protein